MLDELRLEVNKRCNLACDHCYTEKKGRILPIEHFLSLIDQAKEDLGAKSLSLTGGEPLLDLSRTLRLIERGASLGLKVRLNTNGWHVDRPMAQRLKNAGLFEIQISLSHADPVAFDKFVHRRGSFDRACNAIGASLDKELFVTTRMTLMHSNFLHLVPTYELVCALGAQRFKIRKMVEANGARDLGKTMPFEQRQSLVEKLQRKAHREHVPITLADDGEFTFIEDSLFRRLECKCGALAVFVTSDGFVTPCPFLREDSGFLCGNITSDSITSIMNQSAIYRGFVGSRQSDKCGNDCNCSCKASNISKEPARVDAHTAMLVHVD